VEVYGPTTFLLRIETSPAALVPLHAYPNDEFWSPLLKTDIGNWLFYGVLLAMVLYNSFLYVTVRDVSYLFYVLFISSFGLLQLSLDGYMAQYLWPSGLNYQYEYNYWLTFVAVTFASFFVIQFLNLRQTSRAHLRALYGMIALQPLAAVLLLTLELHWFARLYSPTVLLFMGLAISAGIRAWRSGFMAAKFFVLAWVLFTLGNAVFLLSRLFGIEPALPPNIASKMGAFAEAMLLSFALAYRIRLLRDEQERQRMRVEAQSQFLAQISHEIRTPLNGVLGMTEVLSRTRLDEEQRGYVDTIQGSGSSLLALINDILDYSKIEAGKMAFRREPADIHYLVQQQVKLFLSQAEHKALVLTAEIDPSVPHWVMVDAQHLRQVLSNLVSNGIKYTDQGHVRLTLGIDPKAPRLLEFTVEDSGIGISETDQQALFNLYSPVNPGRQRKSGGTGLGLAISQELVALMGGTLIVTSAPDRGSCFTVRLPFLQAQQRLEEARETSQEIPRGLRVMVAEDNMVNQRVIQGLLEKLGHQVVLVTHGGEAVEKRQSDTFDCDLLLMDCEMPHVAGYEATEAIRRFEEEHHLPHLPIVALTAHALEDVRRRCIDAGMDDFLTKPINTRLLVRVLDRMARERLV
jgi:signal transduction histidine kinase/CheY-like chemotaxis protein